MGLYNAKPFQDRLDRELKSNTCPLTGKVMKPCDDTYKSGFSSFHYICDAIHPQVKIGISGTLLFDNLYQQIKNNVNVKKSLITGIQACKQEEFLITTQLIRDLMEAKS
ncbi:MAG: hypothetical protein JJT94_09150 [Bernardetiaceae bacterium]|nr:hypothetical protein [Bernardetiaceae bacterium]